MGNDMYMTVGLGRFDTAQHIEQYSANGVKEFYVGYVPRSWLDKYGWEVCPNRRNTSPSQNFASVSELRDMVQEIHKNGCTLDFAVNAHDNGSERMEDVHEMIELFETMNPDSYIVADPSVLFKLDKWGITRPIHLSTGIGCFNGESIRFFCERFNITRVVFPRKLTFREMREIIDSVSDLNLEFEAMVCGCRCYFNDEDCHSVHSGRGTSLCVMVNAEEHTVINRYPDGWKKILQYVVDTPSLEVFKPGSLLEQFRKEWQKEVPPQYPDYTLPTSGNGLEATLASTLYQNCGLCAIKALRDMGVKVLKVPMRGVAETKLHVVKAINQVLNAENPDHAMCRSIINSPDYCDAPSTCFYDMTGEEK